MLVQCGYNNLGATMIARRNSRSAAVCFVLVLVAACEMSIEDDDASSNKVNGSIDVPAGKAAAEVQTVNGSITVESNGTIKSAGTVNGNIKLGAYATATSLHTVNGRISLGRGAHAAEASTVNGSLTLEDGADLAGRLGNVNGKISLAGAHVGGGIDTMNGDIAVTGASHVEGGIEVEEASSGGLFSNKDPVVIIGPGATVQGDLVFKRKVRLYVSDRATIGNVTGAPAVTYSGDNPPP